MRYLPWLALAAIAGGVALLAYAAATGQGQVYLVLIFPVFSGSGLASFLGMLLLFVGMFLGFWSFARPQVAEVPSTPSVSGAPPPSAAPSVGAPGKNFGGVVFLGPFPIVFGSDARIAKYMLVVGLAMTILLLLFFFLVLS